MSDEVMGAGDEREGLRAGTTPFSSARSHFGHNPFFQPVPVQERGVNLGPRLKHKVDEPQRVGLPQPRQRRQVLFYISAERSTMFLLKTGGLLVSQPKGREFQMWDST